MTYRHSTGEARSRVKVMLGEAADQAQWLGNEETYEAAAERIYRLCMEDAEMNKEAPE